MSQVIRIGADDEGRFARFELISWWDQARLATLVDRIRADGEDPTEYVEISFKVSERKYGAWPSHIRLAFEAARTVRIGKPTFKLQLSTEAVR